MTVTRINAPDAPQTSGRYSQAVAIQDAARWLFVSGQIPVDTSGSIPVGFADQCRLAWRNLEAQLRAADMTISNLVKVNIFLSDRAYAEENRAIRHEVLGDHLPAMTVVIAGIFDQSWLLEIEAIAAA